jgi:signal transduction histidine kinase
VARRFLEGVVTTAIADNFAGVLSQRLAAERWRLADLWLERLKELLPLDPNNVFPSDQLLDHIPLLIGEIAAYVRAPADQEIAANAAVINKARELGALRHEQHASIHQLLREYEILGDILQSFVIEQTDRLALAPSAHECFDVFRRLTRAVAALMRTTVDTFTSAYTMTIQEQNDRIKAFNRTASHELRSPIGTILFAASLLEKDHERLTRNTDRLAKIATTVRTNAERLVWLIENLQRIARLSEPLDVPSQQRTDVRAIANEVARQLQEMAASRRVSIRVADGFPTILVDPARLELVLLNLVSNAIKYSNSQEPESFVEIAPSPLPATEPGLCTIMVRDNGLGIPEAAQSGLFERFFRAHAHLDEELGVTGTGLGLAIVADCVAALGGSIRCESAVGHGTTFYITLTCDGHSTADDAPSPHAPVS